MADQSENTNQAKKRRNANFSRDEVCTLVVEYGKRLSILNFGNREQKQTCWEEITAEINNLHNGFERNVEEIKKKWIDLLYATKKEYVKATKDAAAAGECQRRKLSEISELIVKVRGGFSNKRGKTKNENGVHIISLEIPAAEGGDQPTTIYIPHVDDCHSSTSDIGNNGSQQNTVLMPDGSFSNVHVSPTDTVLEAVGNFETYNHNSVPPPSPPHATHCSCGLSTDLIRLKQETLGVLRRKMQIEEERRIDEKQKWWEEKQLIRLKRQKLELEIKHLQSKQHSMQPVPNIPSVSTNSSQQSITTSTAT